MCGCLSRMSASRLVRRRSYSRRALAPAVPRSRSTGSDTGAAVTSAGWSWQTMHVTVLASAFQKAAVPLSIAWFGADGAFVDRADMEPCPTGATCPTFAPSGAYRYAVEVPLGALDGLGLADGSTVALGAR